MALTTNYGVGGIGRYGFNGNRAGLSSKQKQILASKKKKKKPKTPKHPVPYTPGLPGEKFYQTREWLQLRYQALELCGAACQCCGATRKDGTSLHVDHIRPRSRFPSLELDLTNLQVLCRACNLGKSNQSTKDWR